MFESRFIFDEIPQRPSCHCASMAELPGGELLATWYAGTHEGHPDVAILCARLPSGARAWTAPEVLVDIPGRPGGNTVVFHDGERTLLHFYNIIEGEGWRSAMLYLDRSIPLDEGRTWAGRHNLETEAGEYSYPTLMQASDGRVHLVYTWQRKRIRHLCCDRGWLATWPGLRRLPDARCRDSWV